MDESLGLQGNVNNLRLVRRYLVFAGTIYLLWWFLVESLLPMAFNPFLGRILVVAVIFTVLLSSYISAWARHHLQTLFICCTWLITLHYYYLFYGNGGDINWIFGSYVTVIAVTFCLSSTLALGAYSLLVIFLSVILTVLLPALRNSVFLPGLLTIVIQANIGVRARLKVIKTLLASNDRFQLLFNSTFEGVLVYENRRIVDANRSLAKMLGYHHTELIGKDVLEILHPDARPLAIENMKMEEVTAFETKGLTKNGTQVDIEVRAKNFHYKGRIVRLVTMQDIVDRKQSEQDKIAALTLAENVRIRDEFISIASHELKTPLSALRLQSQMVTRDLQQGHAQRYSAAKLNEVIALFDRQINRLTELVETMLDVSRISTGRLVLETKNFDLSALLRDQVRSLQVTSIRVEAPEHLQVKADPQRIEQVIENLLTNAVKYGEGKPIHVELRAESGETILTVEDHGIGIAQEFIPRIFERFERAAAARNISGLGLGLYITRQIVAAHGGSISVKSRPAQGSTFTVRLPEQK